MYRILNCAILKCARIVSDIKCLACGSALYIRYNTVAHIVFGTKTNLANIRPSWRHTWSTQISYINTVHEDRIISFRTCASISWWEQSFVIGLEIVTSTCASLHVDVNWLRDKRPWTWSLWITRYVGPKRLWSVSCKQQRINYSQAFSITSKCNYHYYGIYK